ncbi:LamG domain-containing protein [bacterium]|nr:LamG domain-containing protein [bacterium]
MKPFILCSVLLSLTFFPACEKNTCAPGHCICDDNNPGAQRYSIRFDGTDDWIDIGDKNALEIGLADRTIEFWFRTDISGVQQQLIRKGFDNRTWYEGRWVIAIDTADVIRINVEDINNSPDNRFRGLGETVVTDRAWHHLAVVFDRDSALTVFLDGTLEMHRPDFTQISSSIHNSEPVHVYLGRSDSHGFYLKGNLFDIRIWDMALPDSVIRENMTSTFSGREDHLICYYKMTEGSGQRLTDHACKNHGQFGSDPGPDSSDPAWSEDIPYHQ